jgi:4-hydroxybenzoate polyprenyltransferase
MGQSPTTSHIADRTSHIAGLALVARDIKLSHSVFALPFALLSAVLAAGHTTGRLLAWPTLGLVVLCMVLARTVAMTVNRWADAKLDALNPRTAGRAIPSGRLRPGFVLAVAGGCVAGFIAATAGFWLLNDNPWPLVLSPFVLAWLAGYSYTKRFTSLCHLYLGSALAMSPLAAAIAVAPAYLARPEPYLLAAMVMCWVAGFDIIYALQDVAVDREHSLFSMPARLGVEPALWVSRLLHVTSVASLVMLWRWSPLLGAGFAVGLVAVAALLAVEHAIVWRSKTRHINMAFFTLNGVISLLLGGLGIADVVMRMAA